ncbi:MAG: hypothetical protein H6780_01850 [Candidatus Nomurabacteria bacterium]|nr:MAG: hypothetical protein H6780_01850 [Candidatus Nomurabacteria bacterium]
MAAGENAIRNVEKTSTSGAVNDAKFGTKIGLARQSSTIRNVSTQNKNTVPSPGSVRRTSADRSDLLQRNITKNVRTSAMPGAPRNQRGSDRKTVDEAFIAEYATKGMQPTQLGETQNATPTPELSPEEERPFIEEEEFAQPRRKSSLKKLQQMRHVGKPSTLRRSAKQLKATTVTYSIWSWSIPAYIFIQLPLGILLAVFFGVGIAVDSIFGSGSVESEKAGGFGVTLLNMAKKVFSSIFEVINYISETFFGFDLGNLHPGGMFFAVYGLFLGLFLLQLLIIYFIYKFTFINPIFGRNSGQKPIMLLLAFIGLSIPIFNLLPWAIFWTLAVWKNPK